MINTDRIILPESDPPSVSGDWFCVQWAPDTGAGEWLNIGVALRNMHGSMQLKLLDQFDRLTCLYNEGIQFHAQLACDIAHEMIMKHQTTDVDMGPQLRLVLQGAAQGDSESDILNALYQDVVPLGRPRQSKRSPLEFSYMSRNDAYLALHSHLRTRLELDYSKHVPDNPYIESKHGPELFMPYKRDNGLATLASAAYSDNWRVKCNLLEAHGELEVALNEQPGMRHGALFLVLPGAGLKSSQRKSIDQAVEKVEWIASSASPRIPVHKSDKLDRLSDEITAWCKAG